MSRSHLDTSSLTASMWTSSLVSGDSSNVPSDVAFYRRASWLEEYASRKLRSIENRSEAQRKRAAETRRSGFGKLLTACLPCAAPKNRLGADQKSVAFSSQTSLTSMLEKAEEERMSRADHTEARALGQIAERQAQRVLMITSSL
ncbi:hypothetical protein M3Y99_01875700 [Aphelenchoides fujianensis]|nr:hypothetical protein M3Y99_01875700 [Aphelenchoides fujianensis]